MKIKTEQGEIIHDQTAICLDCVDKKKIITRLEKGLESMLKNHSSSCVYIDNYSHRPWCNCGASKHNAKINNILRTRE